MPYLRTESLSQSRRIRDKKPITEAIYIHIYIVSLPSFLICSTHRCCFRLVKLEINKELKMKMRLERVKAKEEDDTLWVMK
jgi:hypothetical protein